MVKSIRSAWLSVFGVFQRAERPTNVGHMDKYPTHARVVLPDGQLMYARNASLVAAKDVLAAQRAAERRMQAARVTRLLADATRTANDAEAIR